MVGRTDGPRTQSYESFVSRPNSFYDDAKNIRGAGNDVKYHQDIRGREKASGRSSRLPLRCLTRASRFCILSDFFS